MVYESPEEDEYKNDPKAKAMVHLGNAISELADSIREIDKTFYDYKEHIKRKDQ